MSKRLEIAGWGLFFIWVGIAFLVKVGMGLGLIGVGIITLGVQVVRKSNKLNLEWFWVVIGVLFVIGGIGEIFTTVIPLVPILLILAGAALFASSFREKHKK
jgi:CHASE2 domain-containing sensor protein